MRDEGKMQTDRKKKWLWGAQRIADEFCHGDKRKAYYLLQHRRGRTRR